MDNLLKKYWWLVGLVLTVVVLALINKAIAPTDGINASGFYDDDTEGAGTLKVSSPTVTYNQAPVPLKNFKISEFDSPDAKGSGGNMNVKMLVMLDLTRSIAGIPFHVNSGFRTITHNKEVGGVTNSAHTRGYAADISAMTDEQKRTILKAAYAAGFRRYGYYGSFIHLDTDSDKPTPTIWAGNGVAIKYNPLTA